MTADTIARAAALFEPLQERIVDALERADGGRRFARPTLDGERGGRARPWLLEGGDVVERAAVNASLTRGVPVPPALARRRPETRGGRLDAASVSVIVHPRNPHAPTAHLNLRHLRVGGESESVWWFGGGMDLTPVYGYEEDARAWHAAARQACAPLGDAAWRTFKAACDAYYVLPHRGETRGVGGLFFDDLDRPDAESLLGFVSGVGDAFLAAYMPILQRRSGLAWGEKERAFQRLRRGRYVEFNLLYDRGTRHGLEAGARTESILAALPPEASWSGAAADPEPGSPEADLRERFLVPREWI